MCRTTRRPAHAIELSAHTFKDAVNFFLFVSAEW